MRSGRGRGTLAAAAAVTLLFGLVGCGGSSSDGGSKDSGANSSSSGDKDDGGDSGGDSGDDKAAGELPDPCTLVPIDTASEILGEKSAKPESTSSDIGTGSRSCSWSTQSSIDNPTIEGAGHILSLTVISSPSEAMSLEQFFDSASSAADEKGDVCEKSYWMGGMLSAFQDGVYLTGSAGLADDSADAKEAVTTLVTTACKSLS